RRWIRPSSINGITTRSLRMLDRTVGTRSDSAFWTSTQKSLLPGDAEEWARNDVFCITTARVVWVSKACTSKVSSGRSNKEDGQSLSYPRQVSQSRDLLHLQR